MAQGKWDQFESTAGRVGDDMDFREVVLFNFESTYDPSTGTYDDEMAEVARFEAEVREPSVAMYGDAAGAEPEADVEIYIPDEEFESVDIVTAGSEEKASVIEDTLSGTRYDVHSAFPEDNGLWRVRGVER